ncbi:unnamed protein product, partial [marine sediment metagenome]
DVEVTIGGETWTLEPLKGLRSFHIMPRLLRIVGKLSYAIGQAKIDIQGIFGDDGFNFDAFKMDDLLAFDFIGEVLVEEWPEICTEILPMMLNKNSQFLWNNGTAPELMKSLWAAIKYHGPAMFGQDSWEGLKKSLSAATSEEKEPSQAAEETPSE